MNPSGPIPDVIVQQAIAWMVRLQSGDADGDTWKRCRTWREQHPTHEQAWQQLEALNHRIQGLPAKLAHATLQNSADQRRKIDRRMALKSIALCIGVGTLAMAGRHVLPWQQMLADYGTVIGERKRIMLADGTSIHLNTDTALDIRFDDRQRLVALRRGEVMISTAPDPATNYRPFIVETAEGRSHALGTRFLVRQEPDATLVSVFESAVEATPQQAPLPTRIDAGQQLRFTERQVGVLQPADPDMAAWTEGAIVAKRMRLDDFTRELDRHRRGKLSCDPAVASLQISGVFPLDDPERILAALESTLPIKVERHTSYWITLGPRG